jgi:ribonuclease E
MTIEAKIDRTNELLTTLLALFQQEGKAPTITAPAVTDSELFGTEARQEEKPKRKRRTKAEIAADEAAKQAQAPAKQESATSAPTRDAVKMALIKFRDARGAEAMKQLLLDFDAEALSMLAPEHYAGIIEKADALLNASTEEDDDDAF